MSKVVGSRNLILLRGDITEQEVDAIVNAANNKLQHGGGVALAIAKKAGEAFLNESAAVGYLETGSAVLTTGGELKARFVIHTVGPVWKGGGSGEADLLRSCITSTLHTAEQRELKSLAFPAISTGIYGYPLKLAAKVMLEETINFLANDARSVTEIRFVLFEERDYQEFLQILENL